MPTAWRIVKERHADTAFSGEGAARYGGRWNSRGVPVVYASSSRALALLECLVHLNPPVLFRYVAIPAEFPDAIVERLDVSGLPPEWRAEPPGRASQAAGDAWVREARSAVWSVPSVLVPGESNFLLNPAHPDFRRVTLGAPEPLSFDPRLLT